MRIQIIWKQSIKLFSLISIFFLISCVQTQIIVVDHGLPDRFEPLRSYIQSWLEQLDNFGPTIPSFYVKEHIIDDWTHQRENYQIISNRESDHYNNDGHIPHSINIVWTDVIVEEKLLLLDQNKTQIFYSYYGCDSMLVTTITSLLGYQCKSLDFGMMDWNRDALVKESWDQNSDFSVEVIVNEGLETYSSPVILSERTDIKNIIKDQVNKYFSRKTSHIIRSEYVKEIIAFWENKKNEYQIVDVRQNFNYTTGHVPHAINIHWLEIVDTENLHKLDPEKTLIIYSENGQTGQLATTALNLLGYQAVNILFGMMDWNRSFVSNRYCWDGIANYPVDRKN